MSITIKPSLYATALAPKQEHIKPQAYASYLAVTQEHIKPQAYATYLAPAQEHIKPQAYVSYYFDKAQKELSVDTKRKVNNPEFAAKINTKITKVFLPFDKTATEDLCGNTWTDATACPIGDTNAKQGKALQLSRKQYLSMDGGITLGGKDFTIDFWINYSSSALGWSTPFLLFSGTSGWHPNDICMQKSGSKVQFYFRSSSATAISFPFGNTVHVAIVYQHDTNTVRYFVNGELKGTATRTCNQTLFNITRLGYQDFSGSIDNFRITEAALWTENFTPPEQIEFTENTSVAINVETRRSIRAGVESSADTSRRIGSMVDVYSDTARRVHGEFVTSADLLRGLTGEESLSADTIIRLATRVSMDAETERTLMASVSYISDTIRALRAAQTVSTDSVRRVATTQELDAETSRTINANIDLGNDTERKVHANEETSADIMRRVATAWEAGFDGERTVQVSVDVDADIRRAIQGDTKPRFSTMRRVALSQESTADTQRYIATGLDVPVDTGRSVRQQIEANSDTLRKVGVMKAFEGDAERNIKASVDVKSDLRRGIKNPFSFLADTIVQNGLATELQADTLREVAMSFEVDTKRTVNNPDFKPVGLTFDGTVTVEMPSVLAKRNVFTVDTNVSTTDQAFAGGLLSDAFALLLALLGSGGAGANFGQINLGGGEWEVNFGGIVFRYHDKDIGVNVADGQPHNLAFGFSALSELEEAMAEFMVDGKSIDIFGALGAFTGSDGLGGLTLGTQGEPKHVIDVYQMNVYSTRRTEEEVQRDAMAEPPEEHDWAAILAMLGFNGKGDADDLDHIADDAAGKIKAILQGLPKVVYAIKEPFVPQPVEVVEDTMRRVAWAVEINADLYRYTCGTVLGCDTRRTLKRTVNARIDGQRQLAYTLNSATKVTVPTHKIKWSKSSSDLGTPWREPVMNFTMGAENELYNGTKDISIQMVAGSLTDNCSFSVAHGTVKIGECIQGRILDYEYQLMANHTSGGEEDVIQRISLTTSLDKLLYTSIHYICGAAYSVREVEQKNYNYDGSSTPAGYYTDDNGKFRPYTSVSTSVHYERTQIFYQASRHLNAIARALGLRLVSRFDDYTSVMLGESYGVSYQSLLSELFGWTSRLPQRQVNCFIRGGTLYAIQRGMESNTVDITGMERTSARYERELVRSIWNNADSWQEPSSTLTTVNPGNETGRGEKDTQQPYTEYEEHTEYGKDGSYTTTQTTRQYEHVSELHDAVMIVHETEVCTTYTPMEKSTENVVVDGQTIEVVRGGGMEATTKVATTQHSYDHFGFHTTNTVVTQDGITLSANTSKTLGSTEGVTMYRNQTVRDAGDDTPRDISTDSTEGGIIYGTTTIDAEFPVYYVKGRNGQSDAGDVATMRKLTNAINWLNRKTKETVSLSVYNCGHIIGFDDRIILNGATYFLQSNNFTRNPTVANRQDLTLVRWFKE